MVEPVEPEAPLPVLPKESERRIVEDADARGVPVKMHGGEVWFIPPLPLSPRGQRIAEIMDDIERAEVDFAAQQRKVILVSRGLDSAATVAEVDECQQKLRMHVESRDAAQRRVQELQADLGHQALRTHYRVSREESSALVTQRRWQDVLAALNGQDSEEAEERAALGLLARVRAAGKEGGEGADGPFGRPSPTASAGLAAS